MDLLAKLEAIKNRWQSISEELIKPETINDIKKYASLNKEYSELRDIVEAYHEYREMISNIETNKDILDNDKDQEMRELAKADLDELNTRFPVLE